MRTIRLLAAFAASAVCFAAVSAQPATATEKLEVTISTEEDPPLSGDGSFWVVGEGAGLLCESGTWVSGEPRFWNESDEGFKIAVERTFTCATGETFVLQLRNTIVFGEGGIPGKGRWELKESDGFETAVKGKGSITAGPDGEIYVGLIKTK